MRKLATIRKIDEIRPIEAADSIECAIIGGWQVVVKKSEFKSGELICFIEVDGWVPHSLAPFLSKGQEPREFNGVKGERLRTVKLRKTLSQGLVLPRQVLLDKVGEIAEGQDVTELLGIQKWEPPIPVQLAGDVEGTFPSCIPKTDQERIQNLSAELEEWKTKNYTWEVTEKVDGSSMTVFMKDGHFGVCSRNWELRESAGSTFWRVARDCSLEEILRSIGNFAVQGELVGEGIQGNPYKLKGHSFFVFDVFDIDKQQYMTSSERQEFCNQKNLNHVPVVESKFSLDKTSVADLLKMAEAKSVVCKSVSPEREGLVFKCNEDPTISFKAISNLFLLKEK